MKRLTLHVTFPEPVTPLQRFIDDSPAVERFAVRKAMGATGEDDLVYYLTQFWGDPDAYEAFGAAARVHRYDLFDGPEGSFIVYSLEEVDPANDLLVSALHEVGVFFDLPTVYPVADGAVRLHFIGDHAGLQTVLERYPEAVDVTVERLATYAVSGDRPGLAGALTARQREAIDAAMSVGYYDVPRTGNLAAVSERLDCSTGAASQVLRRAESTVMAEVAG